MWVGWGEFDVLLGDVRSLTGKRVLDAADRFVAERPEVELLGSRQRVARSDDEQARAPVTGPA